VKEMASAMSEPASFISRVFFRESIPVESGVPVTPVKIAG